MITIIKRSILFTLVASLFMATGCEEEESVRIVLDTVEDGMHITSSVDDIELSQEKMDDTALTFNWGPAQQRSNNGIIKYYVKIGLPGMTLASDTIPIEDGVFEYSISHYDLNILTYSKLGLNYGSTTELEAEIIAWSFGDYFVKPEISRVKFVVTSFEIAPVNLYLVGSANPRGEEIPNGIKLTEIVEGRDLGNKYKWEGELQAGTFKFVNSTFEDQGSWSMGADATEITGNETVSESDAEFTVTKPGLYSIIINKSENKITWGYKGFSHVWAVGLGAGVAWVMPSSTEFSWDAQNPNIFTLECTTQAGQDFKLPYNDQSAGWGCPFLRPMNSNGNIWEDNRVQATPSGYNPDLKWLITEEQAGDCILTIDSYNMTISLEKK